MIRFQNDMNKLWAKAVFLILLQASTTFTCFIRDCPPGGKRNFDISQETKQCSRCGPKGDGQCISRKLCCGYSIGCLVHSDYENICSIEKDDCEISGEFCSAVKGGKCVADGFCCKHDKCMFDSKCKKKIMKKSESNKNFLINHLTRALMPEEELESNLG